MIDKELVYKPKHVFYHVSVHKTSIYLIDLQIVIYGLFLKPATKNKW